MEKVNNVTLNEHYKIISMENQRRKTNREEKNHIKPMTKKNGIV